MPSTFSGLEIGKRSLLAHTQGLATVGHNMSNASTEGYSRQRIRMSPSDPLYVASLNRAETPGQLGQGTDVATVERIRDGILEGRIVGRANGQGFWEARDKYTLMVEQVYNEPTDQSVRSLMDKYWDSWQELSINPEKLSSRQAVLRRGQLLIDGIHNRHRSLKEIRNMIEEDVKVTVAEVNGMLRDISALNEQIIKVQAVGDNPNDLMDRRDLLIENLSSIMDITVDNRDPDEFNVHTGGYQLIQGKIVHPLGLEPDPLNESYSNIVWQGSEQEVTIRGGKLAALIEMRDTDLREEIQKLDNMTVNFIDMVNETHRNAYGMNGETGQDFFTEYPFINNIAGNYDRDGDGAFDSTYVFRITGTNSLEPQQQIGLEGTITLAGPNGDKEIPYFSTDTVNDVVERINNSGSEVVARLDRNGKLLLKATPAANVANPDFVIRHFEDSGQFLVGYAGILNQSGADGAYDWEQADAVLNLRGGGLDFAVSPLNHPAGWIEVNRDIVKDASIIAAGFGKGGRPAEIGNNEAALSIAALRNNKVMIGKMTTFDDYFADTIADAGLKGEVASENLETENLIMKDLRDFRASISGVNMDEEMAQLIKFQHGYSAAARFVSEINKMLDTIINRMGV